MVHFVNNIQTIFFIVQLFLIIITHARSPLNGNVSIKDSGIDTCNSAQFTSLENHLLFKKYSGNIG